MKNIYVKGYINYENTSYTFSYENKKLTLINIENKQSFFSEYKYVEFFKGFTVDGFDILFYINNDIYYKNGCYICSPRCIIFLRNSEYILEEIKFDTLRISGGTLNRFYSNRKMIKFDPKEKDNFKFRDIQETVTEEIVNLNDKVTKFELSIMKPDWIDDGIITFYNYDSLLRIKYDSKQDYKEIIKDLNSVDKFFKFSANRIDISFDDIYLEMKNEDDKYDKAAEIIIPYMIDNEVNKDMLDYTVFNGHLNDAFKFLNKSNYIFSIIPDNNKAFETISNKDYCAAFSCFESIYQYIHGNDEKVKKTKDEIILDEVKKELLPLLENAEQKYKGNNKIKRDFIKRFQDIICKANLKLEKCITNELENNDFIVESIYYKTRNEIKENGINKSIAKAVKDRDDITHNNTVKLDNISVGIYQMILKLNFVMILEYIGVSRDIYEKELNHLGLVNII